MKCFGCMLQLEVCIPEYRNVFYIVYDNRSYSILHWVLCCDESENR